jgi:hypothetical protein
MSYGLSLDIDAVKCVDLGHHWIEIFYGRAERGKLKGLPIRIVECETCTTARLDHLTWAGRVTSRVYDHDPAYIGNARALGDFAERRVALRRAKNARMRKEGERGERKDI